MNEDTYGVCDNALSVAGPRLELIRFKEMTWKNAEFPDADGSLIRMRASPARSSRDGPVADSKPLEASELNAHSKAYNVHLFEAADELIYWFATASGPPIATLIAASTEYELLYFDLMFQLRSNKRNGRFQIKSGVIISEKWFATASHA
jgi:hypothetical protein